MHVPGGHAAKLRETDIEALAEKVIAGAKKK